MDKTKFPRSVKGRYIEGLRWFKKWLKEKKGIEPQIDYGDIESKLRPDQKESMENDWYIERLYEFLQQIYPKWRRPKDKNPDNLLKDFLSVETGKGALETMYNDYQGYWNMIPETAEKIWTVQKEPSKKLIKNQIDIWTDIEYKTIANEIAHSYYSDMQFTPPLYPKLSEDKIKILIEKYLKWKYEFNENKFQVSPKEWTLDSDSMYNFLREHYSKELWKNFLQKNYLELFMNSYKELEKSLQVPEQKDDYDFMFNFLDDYLKFIIEKKLTIENCLPHTKGFDKCMQYYLNLRQPEQNETFNKNLKVFTDTLFETFKNLVTHLNPAILFIKLGTSYSEDIFFNLYKQIKKYYHNPKVLTQIVGTFMIAVISEFYDFMIEKVQDTQTKTQFGDLKKKTINAFTKFSPINRNEIIQPMWNAMLPYINPEEFKITNDYKHLYKIFENIENIDKDYSKIFTQVTKQIYNNLISYENKEKVDISNKIESKKIELFKTEAVEKFAETLGIQKNINLIKTLRNFIEYVETESQKNIKYPFRNLYIKYVMSISSDINPTIFMKSFIENYIDILINKCKEEFPNLEHILNKISLNPKENIEEIITFLEYSTHCKDCQSLYTKYTMRPKINKMLREIEKVKELFTSKAQKEDSAKMDIEEEQFQPQFEEQQFQPQFEEQQFQPQFQPQFEEQQFQPQFEEQQFQPQFEQEFKPSFQDEENGRMGKSLKRKREMPEPKVIKFHNREYPPQQFKICIDRCASTNKKRNNVIVSTAIVRNKNVRESQEDSWFIKLDNDVMFAGVFDGNGARCVDNKFVYKGLVRPSYVTNLQNAYKYAGPLIWGIEEFKRIGEDTNYLESIKETIEQKIFTCQNPSHNINFLSGSLGTLFYLEIADKLNENINMWGDMDKEEIIEKLFERIDQRLRKGLLETNINPIIESLQIPTELNINTSEGMFDEAFKKRVLYEDKSGSTATVLLLDSRNLKLKLFNLGDSSILRYKYNTNMQRFVFKGEIERQSVTKDKIRIESDGWFVKNNRINGTLCVPRQFGSYNYKDKTMIYNDITQTEVLTTGPGVSLKPNHLTIQLEKRNNYLILLTSDGANKVLRSKRNNEKNAIDMFKTSKFLTESSLQKEWESQVLEPMKTGEFTKLPQNISNLLVKESLTDNSPFKTQDNITILSFLIST